VHVESGGGERRAREVLKRLLRNPMGEASRGEERRVFWDPKANLSDYFPSHQTR
jgi:hypothetical protein